jgi:filamentous hemagglutinin
MSGDPFSVRTPFPFDPSIVPSFGKNGNVILRGTRDGVEIEVIRARPGGWFGTPEGGIVTGYPTNVPRNPK